MKPIASIAPPEPTHALTLRDRLLGHFTRDELCAIRLAIDRTYARSRVDLIILLTAAHFMVDVAALYTLATRRTTTVMWARSTAIYALAHFDPALSHRDIGILFGGWNHSTVYYSVQRVKHRLDTEPKFRASVDALFATIHKRLDSEQCSANGI